MSLTLSQPKTTKREPIEAGMHIARCIQIIDLGTQKTEKFGTDETVFAHRIRITWELPNEIMEWEDKTTKELKSGPRVLSAEYKASLHEKASLRKMLASWRGRDFTEEELEKFVMINLLDKPCMLNIMHEKKEDKVYEKITAVTPLGKGMTCPDRISDLIHYEIEDGVNDTFALLPEFIQNKIRESVEVAGTEQDNTEYQEPPKVDEIDIDEAIAHMPF